MQRKRSFTVIELIVILVIAGLLPAATMPAFMKYDRQSRTVTVQTVR